MIRYVLQWGGREKENWLVGEWKLQWKVIFSKTWSSGLLVDLRPSPCSSPAVTVLVWFYPTLKRVPPGQRSSHSSLYPSAESGAWCSVVVKCLLMNTFKESHAWNSNNKREDSSDQTSSGGPPASPPEDLHAYKGLGNLGSKRAESRIME